MSKAEARRGELRAPPQEKEEGDPCCIILRGPHPSPILTAENTMEEDWEG